MTELTPLQEHYLKRELLRLELNNEFEKLNDINALRKFGHPFSENPVKDAHEKHEGSHRLSGRFHRDSKGSVEEFHSDVVTEFPILSHFLHNFVMTFPLLSKDLVQDPSFWEDKVQAFFEHFMSLPFSSSFDREEMTKRRKLALKFSKAILLFYNSGIGVSKEVQYYEQDKYEIVKDAEKATKLNKFTMPTKDDLQYLLTNEPVYFNGIDVNIVAVVEHHVLFPHHKKLKPTKNAANKWMKSNLGFDFSKLSLLDSGINKKKYYFIIKVRKEDPLTCIFIYKTYDDFKKLAHDLKTAFPGKKVPKLPHKNKIEASLKQENDGVTETFNAFPNEEELEEDNENDYEEFEEESGNKNRVLPRERMRTSLRQYLRTICQEKEISTSSALKLFLFPKSSRIYDEEFSDGVKSDIKNRQDIDLTNLEHQVKFQKIAFERSLKLQDSLKEFKSSLLKDEAFLLGVFGELKEKRDPRDLSPILRDFFDWCKIYISATVYQLFIGNDNGYELYKQIRRLHKLVPYTIMIQILKFTNPIAIMKGMMDLFMAQPFGGHSLLQTMFSTVLSDDLKSQTKAIDELEALITSNHNYGSTICAFLKKCVFENEDSSVIDMAAVHEEVKIMGMPFTIIIAMKGTEMGYLPSDLLAELMESYTYWKNEQQNSTELVYVKTNETLSESVGVYFTRVKEYLHLLIQERDKMLMKKLWEDPELSQLLKSMVQLFYEPMIKVFKVARMDIAFRNFEKFMSDLIILLDNIIDGNKGSITVTNIVDEINELINKHETSFYQFAHDIYVNDTQGIFEGFIKWICSIINFLQHSKFAENAKRIDLELMLNESDNVNADLLKEQLDATIEKRLESRKLYSKLVKSKTTQENKPGQQNVNKLLDDQWKHLNHMVIPNESSDFNIAEADLVDLDLDAQDYDYLHSAENEEIEQQYKEILDRDVPVFEIKKFLEGTFKSQLHDILDV